MHGTAVYWWLTASLVGRRLPGKVSATVEWVAGESDDATREGGSPNALRYSRRLSDKILVAFHHACDESEVEVAEALLRTTEALITRRVATPDAHRRRSLEALVAGHERLWHLRNKGIGES